MAMALAIDTNHMLQHCIPYNEPLRMGRSRGRYELHKLHAYATAWSTSLHNSSAMPAFELTTATPATQAALDWQADQDDVLDDLEVFHHLKHMATTYSFPEAPYDDGAMGASCTTLVASVQSPIFNLRAQGRPPNSFHRYSLRMIVFEYNYYVCNIFGYDFNGMDESGIGETNMHKVLPSDGDARRSCYNLLPWFLSPRIVWATTAENPAVLWHMQLDFVDLLSPIGQSSRSLGKRRRSLNPFHRVSSTGGDHTSRGLNHLPEAKRFKGVRYRPDRRTWVAEMRPPKSKNKVSFGDFKCQIQAARAVDAAYHYFHKIHHINFADSCEILTTKPAPAELSGEDMLRFVKEQAKWLASMAYSLPPTPTSALARAAVDVALVDPYEVFPESSRGFNAVTFRFRSFSEITPSSSSHTDKADDGISQPIPNFAAADHVGVVNEVEEGQSMFQWMLENAMVDPARSPVARKLSSSVQIIDELADWTDSCSRILPSFLNSPGSEQRMMSPGLDVLSMSPPATLYLW
ncbi:hypothetical protein KC19_9G171100 [Ceratodon purpureus]|uniref:AP2/ERF domain-containing protein n=1 Tax=Ceratodon purpureus TaxID=3225 RepID=A0A8T0GYF9_CERPU|nr:hypothetical protein KC19_9G171100 [Ceratodon purpureus]